MKTLLLPLLLVSVAADKPPEAISCQGSSSLSHTMAGELISWKKELPEQIFVFDEAKRLAQRSLKQGQKFDPICSLASDGNWNASFSSKAVEVVSDGPVRGDGKSKCRFSFDRTSGAAQYTLRLDMDDGRFLQDDWVLSCRSTSLPVTYLKRD